MKIILAQLNPLVGDIDGNLKKVLDTLARTKNAAPDLVVFPELFLLGYPPQDLVERDWFIRRQLDALDRLKEASGRLSDTGIIIGAALPRKSTQGKPLSNAAVLIYQGETIFTQAKSLLPTYDVFNEERYFQPASVIEPAVFRGEKLGLTVCEDAWVDKDLWPQGGGYATDPVQVLAAKGASLIINIAASPFEAGKHRVRTGVFSGHAKRFGRPFLVVNQVGGNDELVFDGQSMAFGPKGEVLSAAPGFCEALVEVDLGKAAPLAYEPPPVLESVRRALVLGVRDYLGKSGFSSAVVGLSGGIDSALTFTLAVQALGPENVLGVLMPSMYSSAGSVSDSERLAKNLGAPIKTVPITAIFEAYLAGLAEPLANTRPDTTEENIQARIRGNILMAISNKFGSLVLTTGNKSELAMGYCTLYGDMAGGLAVIADLPKTMVYALARHINAQGEIIPQSIIEKPPSAELRPDQKDEDSLPPYDILDQILNDYIEEGLDAAAITAKGHDPETVRWVITMVNRNEYKRAQAPPALKITAKAFGVGRRMPIVAKHDAL